MCAVMWRWASEYAGFASFLNYADAEDAGNGECGWCDGDGVGTGIHHAADWGTPVDHDNFDFRTGKWRFL